MDANIASGETPPGVESDNSKNAIMCAMCGKVEDFFDAQDAGWEIQENLEYICNECIAKKKATADDKKENAKVIETTISIKKLKEEDILIDKGYGCGYSNQEVINAGLIYSFSKSRNADDSEIISQFENELDMSLQITFNEIVDEEFIAGCKNQAEYY